MNNVSNHSRFLQLRQEFSFFEYQSYSFREENEAYRLRFNFNLGNKFYFHPETLIPKKSFLKLPQNVEQLNWLVFNIGMVELISYWKLACPEKVIIKPYRLDEQQHQWWKKLYYNGLGEFFYVNGIKTTRDAFMQIESEGDEPMTAVATETNQLTIVPVGGGKDSVVTLELLRQAGKPIVPMIVNPRKASLDTAKIAGFEPEQCLIFQRTLDPQLLKLNAEGFLNGHTPFSALLAFLSALGALFTGAPWIALSNESSASESTVHNEDVNHQYSKSIEFEDDFIWYMQHYLLKNAHYFSFLRPVSELQIAQIFSRFQPYHAAFRSCNAGSKTDSWCNNCPKCLFTYLMLSPFVKPTGLKAIFGENLLQKNGLKSYLDELRGKTAAKPFECVGTVDEVELSCQATGHLFPDAGNTLLQDITLQDFAIIRNDLSKHLQQFETNRHPDKSFTKILRDAISN